MFSSILKIIFPKNCLGCKEPDLWICQKCLEKAVNIRTEKLNSGQVCSVFEYHEKVIRKAIWMLKFEGKYSVLNDMEKCLDDEFKKFCVKNKISSEEIFLIPIPQTKRSRQKRKYNQSKLIAERLAKHDKNIKVKDKILFKTKNHLPQNKIKNRAERLANVKNSFSANKINDTQKTFILIDDVMTTGATLGEAAKTLRSAGAKKIFAFTLAR
jgi:ComF family protein